MKISIRQENKMSYMNKEIANSTQQCNTIKKFKFFEIVSNHSTRPKSPWKPSRSYTPLPVQSETSHPKTCAPPWSHSLAHEHGK